ncbi:hypothetical protein [Vibrio casei]|uniref:hypothetical protein n=1 Tax=Vibrio casei TaxID=673372 RepID=UPI003F9D1545
MKLMNTVKRYSGRVAAVGSAALAPSVFANEEVTAAINSAVSTGQTNYGLVVVGLIALAAIGFGLRMIIGAMR